MLKRPYMLLGSSLIWIHTVCYRDVSKRTNSEFFARILFSRIVLKNIYDIKNSCLWHDLPTSVNDRVISSFHEGFIFTAKFHQNIKKKRENFQIYSM